ncbi:MAG: CaiB/BaiF CoA transferase family protein [Saprospiraceae bacterium]
MFQNLTVVELASVLAGPAVGMFFSELGARVIKIENKTTKGDVTRRWKLPTEPATTPLSAYYCSVNYKKESLLLDLRSTSDYETVLQLIAAADIVISNFKNSSAQKLKLDAATLRQRFPKLIYAQLNGYPNGNDKPAFDVVLQAEAGFMYMNGSPDGLPVKMPVALIDILAAHQLKEGILVALLQRERTGEGSTVTTSLYESALASLANQATNWLMANHIPQRMGSQHPNIAPYGDIFKTKDHKDVVLAIGTEQQFKNLCKALEYNDLVTDERYKTNTVRVQHRKELAQLLQTKIAHWERDDLLEKLTTAKVPAGSIKNMQEVFSDETAQQMILKEKMSDGSTSNRVKTVAFQLRK